MNAWLHSLMLIAPPLKKKTKLKLERTPISQLASGKAWILIPLLSPQSKMNRIIVETNIRDIFGAAH